MSPIQAHLLFVLLLYAYSIIHGRTAMSCIRCIYHLFILFFIKSVKKVERRYGK
jgi:hypothetical protein